MLIGGLGTMIDKKKIILFGVMVPNSNTKIGTKQRMSRIIIITRIAQNGQEIQRNGMIIHVQIKTSIFVKYQVSMLYWHHFYNVHPLRKIQCSRTLKFYERGDYLANKGIDRFLNTSG